MSLTRFLVFILALTLVAPSTSFSTISLPWSTSFNYAECTQRGGGGATDCSTVADDGVEWNWGATAINGNYTQNTNAANNPLSVGNGARFWVGDGDNQNSGEIKVTFATLQTEIWVRWYMRYQYGSKWLTDGDYGNTPLYDKMIYIKTTGLSGSIAAIPEWKHDFYTISAQASSADDALESTASYGWSSIMGGDLSDGNWHLFEIHIKMDTGGANGIGQVWIDNTLAVENMAMNWSNNNSNALLGWSYIEWHGNHRYPDNSIAVYVDYDDIAISNTGYIGPIEESSPAHTSNISGSFTIQ